MSYYLLREKISCLKHPTLPSKGNIERERERGQAGVT
jgi:hypothetical protein